MAAGGFILESDETSIQPCQLSRHKVHKKHEKGYRWCPGRARHVPDTREGLLSPDCTSLLGLGAFLGGFPGCWLMLAV